jgi:GT2 family glycosyltransferase
MNSFVIPIYHKWYLTNQVLEDIHKHCSDVLEVIIVNDNSPEQAVYDGLEVWKHSKRLPIREIRLEENVMFLKATNIGLRESVGENVITISNDVRVQSDISKQIDGILSKKEKSFVGGKIYTMDTGWNTFDGRIFPYIEGWLMATTKSGWEELGYLDEQFAPSDMEDVDISTKALSMGYELVPLNNPMVRHIGAQSIGYNPEREKITIRNKELFRKKWIDG